MAGDEDRTTEVDVPVAPVPAPVGDEPSVPTAVVPEDDLARLMAEATSDDDDPPTLDQADAVRPVAAGKRHADAHTTQVDDDDDMVTDVVSPEALHAVGLDPFPVEEELDERPTEISYRRPGPGAGSLELPLAPDELELTGVVNIEDAPAGNLPPPELDEPAEPPPPKQSAVVPQHVETEPIPKVTRSGAGAIIVLLVIAAAAAAVIVWLMSS